MVQEEQPPQARGTTHEDVPDWWPYAAEFPHWHLWQGVSGLLYACSTGSWNTTPDPGAARTR
jgi:hypothetical protein